MAKKQFFLIADTETTEKDHVLDFGAVVVDRKGEIFAECGIILNDFKDELPFHDEGSKIWALEVRREINQRMLDEGARMLASVAALNRWLEKVNAKFSPILTAYNLAFDLDKCKKSGVDLEMFADRFCLWHAANATICETKKYRQFVLDNHLFNSPTDLGNMTFQTNAEAVAGFVTGNYLKEPHTALEDAKHFEAPILMRIIRTKNWREKMKAYNWRDRQVKDWFSV